MSWQVDSASITALIHTYFMDKRKSNTATAEFLLCDAVQKARRKAAKTAENPVYHDKSLAMQNAEKPRSA
ncbi:hypothetical protein ACCY16_03495 [Candidatus Pantoea formicae]|uniref:hypothetical protein n=1 Tax=Candidatus Pantoea formicae TaxID=2608355 RepID=UPI003EDA46A0